MQSIPPLPWSLVLRLRPGCDGQHGCGLGGRREQSIQVIERGSVQDLLAGVRWERGCLSLDVGIL